MAQVTPHPDDVRQALEVLMRANPSVLDEVVTSMQPARATMDDSLRDLLVYRGALTSLQSTLSTLPGIVDPATARATQATENVWRRVGLEFGLLSSSDVARLLGARNGNRTFAGEKRKRRELLGAKRTNEFVYPGFQFDHAAGAVRPWVAPLLELAATRERSAANVTMWMMSPTTYFDGERPADHVEDAQRLLDVARRAWDTEW